jgi:hypothetical protein
LYQNAYVFFKKFSGVIPRIPFKGGEEEQRKKREGAVGRAGKRGQGRRRRGRVEGWEGENDGREGEGR